MSEILQETTKWTGDYLACNHTYLLDNQNRIIAYIKHNDDQVNVLKTQIKIDKRYRTFIKVRNNALERLIPSTLKSNTRVFKVKSNTKEYIVELNDSNYSCTCTGYSFRGKCKHITAVAEKQQSK
jgi:predicted nucleic acid-binding Zn finger protein